ncbi:serine/threonine-protein kinase [Zavarzinella formosa]|uniref:hypothetical protein n=1 Tax=Zavarzinella formosa TaxID=360055 RepID=UPI0002E32421|nr:hypothetical protein [Zavarzinella formosa]
MARLQQFVECLGASLCEYATAALARLVPFETALLEVAKATYRNTSHLSPADIRMAIREIVSSPAETVELAIQDAIYGIRPEVPEEFRESLLHYLELLPEIARQALRRPGDMEGVSVPEQFQIKRAEDWLLFLPDRLPSFRPGDLPAGLDNWRVETLRGLGPHSEVWEGYDDEQPELSPACLKFVNDSRLQAGFRKYEPLLRRVLDLDVYQGLIPLRSAYLQSRPPCLEYVQIHGYDLANLMHDARWRGDRPRPDQAATIARRLARITGKLHHLPKPMIHRGLKPSNVLLSPTTEGKVSVWVSDIGWGEITAPLANQHLDVSQALRRSLRGSHSALYASPQMKAGKPSDPRDDVYAIGMIWYQLLQQDPTCRMPDGMAWIAELRRHGFTDGQASLLMSCLSENPDERPSDGLILADMIAANSSLLRPNDSGTIRLQGSSYGEALPPVEGDNRPRLFIRPSAMDPEDAIQD